VALNIFWTPMATIEDDFSDDDIDNMVQTPNDALLISLNPSDPTLISSISIPAAAVQNSQPIQP
jgi:hypothetical protein